MSDLDRLLDQARAREDEIVAALDLIQTPDDGWDIPPDFRRPAPVEQPPTRSPYRELLVLWPGWQDLVDYVSREHPTVAEPQSIYGMCMFIGRDRLASLLFAHMVGDTLAESELILEELLEMACAGRRPRTGTELGLRPEMFEGGEQR